MSSDVGASCSNTLTPAEIAEQRLKRRKARRAEAQRKRRQADPELRAREAQRKRQRRRETTTDETRARHAERQRQRQRLARQRELNARAERLARQLQPPGSDGADDRFQREFLDRSFGHSDNVCDRLCFDNNVTEVGSTRNERQRNAIVPVLRREFTDELSPMEPERFEFAIRTTDDDPASSNSGTMLPCQPFYRSTRDLPLTPVLSTRTSDLKFFCTVYTPRSQSNAAATVLFICFAPIAERSSLSSSTASLSLNGRAYHRLPFTMVNIFPVIDRAVKNCMAIWNELIPEKVTVRTIEAVKVLEDELLSSFDESAAYAMRREDTTALVKAHFSIADEAVVENLQMSLICPIAKRRIHVPCRGARCQHIQCFDAYAYLALNEGTLHPSWRCPVCNEQVFPQDIRIDVFTLDALRQVDSECSAVDLLPNGSWAPLTDHHKHSVIIIDDSPVKTPHRTPHERPVIDLTVDSD